MATKTEKILPLSIWNDIENVRTERIDIVYEGERIVGISNCDDWENAITEIDRLCKKLQAYNSELKLLYNQTNDIKHRSSLFTYVYVIKCNKTGLHKIGRSINPDYREKTIRSENLEVSQVFISPMTHPSKEKDLHKYFKEKRIRGEWFNLLESDLNFIKEFDYGTV